MTRRRTFLRGLAAGSVGVATIAGCLDVLAGEGPLEFAARPIGVTEAVLTDTGYELNGVHELVLEREFTVADQTREVRVTNYQTEYAKPLDMGPLGSQEAAVFTVLTTPQVRVLGREFNPVAEMSTTDLAEMVQDQYDGIRDLEHIEDTQVTIHGEPTTQSKFRARGNLVGDLITLYLHVTEAVPLDEDLAVTVGAYPELHPDEEANILRLMEAVEPDT